MTKGKHIQLMLADGKSNEEILAEVETTSNSINWYRSKNKKKKGIVKSKKSVEEMVDDVFDTPTMLKKLLDEKCQTLFSLQDRWQDEKEYENFEDYKDVVSKMFLDFGFLNTVLFKSFHITTNYQGKKITIKIFKSGKIAATY